MLLVTKPEIKKQEEYRPDAPNVDNQHQQMHDGWQEGPLLYILRTPTSAKASQYSLNIVLLQRDVADDSI